MAIRWAAEAETEESVDSAVWNEGGEASVTSTCWDGEALGADEAPEDVSAAPAEAGSVAAGGTAAAAVGLFNKVPNCAGLIPQ